jgi:hypothetical protein
MCRSVHRHKGLPLLSGFGRDRPPTIARRAPVEELRLGEDARWIGATRLAVFEFGRSSVSRPTTGAPHLELSHGTNPLEIFRFH